MYFRFQLFASVAVVVVVCAVVSPGWASDVVGSYTSMTHTGSGRNTSQTYLSETSNTATHGLVFQHNQVIYKPGSGDPAAELDLTVSGGSISSTIQLDRSAGYGSFATGLAVVEFTALVPFSFTATSQVSFTGALSDPWAGTPYGSDAQGFSTVMFFLGSDLHRYRDNALGASSGTWSLDTVDSTVKVNSSSGTYNGDGTVFAPGKYTYHFGMSHSHYVSHPTDDGGTAVGTFTLNFLDATPIPPPPPPPSRKIVIQKFYDLDADGLRDPGEPSMSGVDFTVEGVNGGATHKVRTSANGEAVFEEPSGGLAATYAVNENMGPDFAGWTNTLKPISLQHLPGNLDQFDVASGETLTLEYGNAKIPTFTVTKTQCVMYLDVNGNGIWDENDISLQKFPITLTAPDSTQTTVLTNSDGYAAFDLTVPGVYSVTQSIPADFALINPQPITFFAQGNSGAGTEYITIQMPLQVQEIPEPSSALVLSVMAGPVLLRRRRGS
ncbi:MAG: hypothetical protein K8S99_07595 [Planctomycetes bacterium]|nr:hypothetical protein [Planctomycetota bacterium]